PKGNKTFLISPYAFCQEGPGYSFCSCAVSRSNAIAYMCITPIGSLARRSSIALVINSSIKIVLINPPTLQLTACSVSYAWFLMNDTPKSQSITISECPLNVSSHMPYHGGALRLPRWCQERRLDAASSSLLSLR